MKFFLRAFLLLAFLLALPFLLEAGLAAYDYSEPIARPGAAEADGAAVAEGLNRRFFSEPRFRAVGLGFRFEQPASNVVARGEGQAAVRGRFRLLALATVLPPEAGPAPPATAVERVAFNFVLPVPEQRRAARAVADGTPLVWAFEPETDADREAAAKLDSFSFRPDRTFEIDLDFRTPVPPGLSAVFTYSKGTRSILRGSFLEPVARKFMNIAP
ncbi:MAG: hypothetical protein IJV65_05700 [Kiritimatiellae bacterium]|nr:hypothetical protein [Kiritimatiellia bacterium]